MEYNDENIFTLTNPDGEEIDFEEIAGIEHEGIQYLIALPVEPMDGVDEDEAFVFEITYDEDNNALFNLILDDDLLDIIFAKYQQLLDDME